MKPDVPKADLADLVSDRKKPRRQGVNAYTKNPFWNPTEVKIGTRKITIAGGFMSKPDTGEGIHHTGIHRVEWVDEDKFVKVFTQNLKMFFDLTKSTQAVLQCVIDQIQQHPGADGIWLPWFDVEDYSLENDLKISRTSYHRAMREMLDKGFLAESEKQNFYWINPHLFFNGDRMTFITEYRKKATKEQKTNQLESNDQGHQDEQP